MKQPVKPESVPKNTIQDIIFDVRENDKRGEYEKNIDFIDCAGSFHA